MKNKYSTEEFKKLLNNGTIKVSKKRFRFNSNELLSNNEQNTTYNYNIPTIKNKKVKNAKKTL